ncbi:F-box domain protein, partial [Aureobasidium melanogenum]
MTDDLTMQSSNKSGRSLRDKLRSTFGRKSADDTNSPRRKSSAGESVASGRKSSHRASLDSRQDSIQVIPFKTQAERIREARETGPKIDKQTGELLDGTLMLHSLAHDSFDTVTEVLNRYELDPNRRPGEPQIASLSPQLWNRIAEHLSLIDRACLALSSKTLLDRVGSSCFTTINHPDNAEYRLEFLHRLQDKLPNHLFCFVCNKYHLRTLKGEEKLKPASVLNPLFDCPHATNNLMPQPRIRITTGRTLPYTFVQLALRGKKYGLDHGIEATTMARLWREPYEPRWTHSSRYFVFKGHLLMRVQSTAFTEPGLTPAGERMLLYSREDYLPYFSVCAHWRDGLLMKLCKCALSHLPVPPEKSLHEGLAKVAGRRPHQSAIIVLCSECRPMRRCPECPTEYLIEVKLAEDRSEKDPRKLFKHAIVVTRWSDLGDGSSPSSPEWAAVTGAIDNYDSLTTIGTRAVSGTFESQSADTGPGQRILNLNPKDEHKGEEGHEWY